MVTRRECIESIESNLEQGNSVSLRNAARSLADYCRIILSEIGSHHSGYGIIKGSSIKQRFDLLCPIVPDLLKHKKLFDTIQKTRDTTEHTDEFIPSSALLQDLTDKVKNLDRIFETVILPNLAKMGKIQEKFLKELEEVLEISYDLDKYPGWATPDLNRMLIELREFETIASRLKHLDTEVLQEERLKLRDLKNQLDIILVQAEEAVEWENAQMEYDRIRGK